MLLDFGLKNFFSFRQGAQISFRLDGNCPHTVSRGRDFATVMSVKGANASGKTHLLKALTFVGHFCSSSFSTDPADPIPVSPFYDTSAPCEFFVSFGIQNETFEYELVVSDSEVLVERLYRVRSRKVKILERVGNELKYRTKDLSKLSSIKLRSNASIISTAHHYEFDELKTVRTFFHRTLSNVTFSGFSERFANLERVSELLHRSSVMLEFVQSFIRECDTGVSSVEVVEKDTEGGKKEYFPIFVHEVAGEKHPVTIYSESSGTKALYRHLPHYKAILGTGGLLILDEFDINLHPHILPKLVELFLNPESNPQDAQLIFTTHNTDILDFLGRYRTYLVNKEENESFVYRLDELPGDLTRNDRSIIPSYNDGRLGGVPRL